MNTRKFLSMLSVFGLILSSCSDDDDPVPVSGEEVITTMTVTLTNGSDTVTLRFFDEDGEDGPTNPVETVSGSLSAGTTYTGTIALLNETESPAELVNEEIEGEADEHQFFYLTDDLGITTAYADQECDFNDDPCEGSNANPVGLAFTLTTTDAVGDGELRVVLRHELNKEAQGVAAGDITNAGGSPDIDWTFNVSVE
ncbi:type 1 periplasmic binding fold superfamily protein [Aquimarina sp. BL5]|uniref:type 1 periplasmic binding fold superfamily protein n=1 Tax=Aquimarina sp. BL5 TaxID=1714860 RepID=UPI000E4F8BF1|nr:type 1 periplasmic binding fold superfamily protein [Aquimarina sp. BL5]AXT52079.1 type 1 periplasmic binding fold superfamily protein [Aquimarina sp. BL5]RKN11201.1 type 1 periplasmic binding fold superfamily protein [Aquimarina sp. BL5]